MADQNLENNPEYQAIKDMIATDDTAESKPEEKETASPESQPQGEKPSGEQQGNPATQQSAETGDPPATSSQTEQGDGLLKEIFGDRFNTVQEAKEADIPTLLSELETLRNEKQELTSKLESKPKTDWANDDIALFNQFVKETGIDDFSLFSKLHKSDVANMDPMDALIADYRLKNPGVGYQDGQIKRYFEKKYGYDPEMEGDEDNELAKMQLQTDAQQVKKDLSEIKSKLQVPEAEYEQGAQKKLSEQEIQQLGTQWQDVGAKVSTALGKLQIPIKNRKEALLEYEITSEEQKEITDFVKAYAVENQMELNQENVKVVSTMVYNQLMINKLPEIVHSVFEKARSLTEEQVHSLYDNPSPQRNQDTPPEGEVDDGMTEEERIQEQLFQAEMGNYRT